VFIELTTKIINKTPTNEHIIIFVPRVQKLLWYIFYKERNKLVSNYGIEEDGFGTPRVLTESVNVALHSKCLPTRVLRGELENFYTIEIKLTHSFAGLRKK